MKECSPDRVKRLICKYQKALRLEDWDIYYIEDELPEDPDDCASISHNGENHIAKIRINFPNMDERINTLEQTIAHELTHLYTWQLRMLVCDLIEHYVSDAQAKKIYAKLVEEHEERLVERVSALAVQNA